MVDNKCVRVCTFSSLSVVSVRSDNQIQKLWLCQNKEEKSEGLTGYLTCYSVRIHRIYLFKFGKKNFS